MPLPARRSTSPCSVTAPLNVCVPVGAVSLDANWMPCAPDCPCVARFTAPAPFVTSGPAIVIVSLVPAPVLMLTPCEAAPRVTVRRFTPPLPIVTESVPAPPKTDSPANFGSVFRFTAIVSAFVSTEMPTIGTAVEIVPLLAAVIVSTPDAAL